MRYSHTQTGYPALVGLLIPLIFFIHSYLKGRLGIDWPMVLILLLAMILFVSLTVSITLTHLELRYWMGFITLRFPLSEIVSCRVVNTGWAWGIHITKNGWLYNVSGFRGVEIVTNKGKTYQVGSDEPEKLADALREACGFTA